MPHLTVASAPAGDLKLPGSGCHVNSPFLSLAFLDQKSRRRFPQERLQRGTAGLYSTERKETFEVQGNGSGSFSGVPPSSFYSWW